MKRHNMRCRAGFTMTELMVVLAIMAVLLAVAIPSIGALRKSMKMNEVDAAAHGIFTASQDRLIGMKSSGTLHQFAGATVYASSRAADGRRYLSTENPTDAAMLDRLLPEGTIEPRVAGNHYVIVFNQVYGTVLEVFYGEKVLPDASLLFTTMSGHEDAAAAARKDTLIGYYDGDDAWASPLEKLPQPMIEVRNDDELSVKITITRAVSVLREADLFLQIKAGAGAAEKTVQIHADAVNTTTGETTVVLDSLAGGIHIQDVFGSDDFEPGMQLNITAQLRPKNASGGLLPVVSGEVTANSLFADRTGDTVQIACARHLQNLASKYSGVNERSDIIRAAEQTKEIVWPADLTFRTISTPELAAYDGKSLEIRGLQIGADGDDQSIGMFAQMKFSSAGAWNRLENVRLVNAAFKDQTGALTAAGLLAGSVWNTKIINCAAYVSPDADKTYADYAVHSKLSTTGGLVGEGYDSLILNSFVALPSLTIADDMGVAVAGGLMGIAQGCEIRSSYAAIDQLGGKLGTAALLVGKAENNILTGTPTSVVNSYAVGNISAEARGDHYYGFIGGAAAVSSSYSAATYLSADGTDREIEVTPFATNAVTRCAYLALRDQVTAKNDIADALKPQELVKWRGEKEAAWATLEVHLSHPYQQKLQGKAYPYPALNTQDEALPENYGAAIAHYGSWPAASLSWLAYYEFYDNDTGKQPHLYMPAQADDAGAPVIDTLMDWKTAHTTQAAVQRDGYALVSLNELEKAPDATWPLQNGTFSTAACEVYGNNPVEINGVDYYLYFLPKQALEEAPPASDLAFYRQIVCNGERFWYNPYFTAPTGRAAPPTPSALRVRSARQLANLGKYNRYWAFDVTQDINVNFAAYTASPNLTQSCIGNMSKSYTGHYEAGGFSESGESFQITNLIVGMDGAGEDAVMGLFGVVGQDGAVSNVSISPTAMQADIPAAPAYAGFLVGKNEGTLTNCKVNLAKSLNVTGNAFGCLTGLNAGTGSIDSCAVYGSNATVSNAGGDIAGFAGTNHGAITNSMVRAIGSYKGLVLHTAKDVWGFVGTNTKLGTGTGSIRWCLTTLRLEADGVAAGFAGTNNASIFESYANCEVSGKVAASGFVNNNSATVSDCYALLYASSDQKAAGFSANSTAGLFKNCYAAVTAKSKVTSAQYGFAPTSTNIFSGSSYYLAGEYTGSQGGAAKSFDELTELKPGNGAWTFSEGDAQPYTAALGTTYPFAHLQDLQHFGDWPAMVKVPTGMVYYERYSDGTYGLYGQNEDAQTVETIDRKNVKTITDWGYGVMAANSAQLPSVLTYAQSGGIARTISTPFQSTALTKAGTQQLFAMTAAAMKTLKSLQMFDVDLYCVSLTFTWPATNQDANYALAPSLAAAVIKTDSFNMRPNFGKDPKYKLEVRTADQLRVLAPLEKTTVNNAGRTYYQTHDITLPSDWNGLCIITQTIFDGGNYKIKNLRNAQLFSGVGNLCTVRNVVLENPRIEWDAALSAGIFTTTNQGTIESCKIIGGLIAGKNTVVGFVRLNDSSGVIRNCSIAPAEGDGYAQMVVGDASYLGANAGFVWQNSGMIENCYFVGTVQAQKNSGSVVYGFAGSNSGTIKNCYANSVLTAGSTVGFNGNNSASITDCYAISEQNYYAKSDFVLRGCFAAGFANDTLWGSYTNCYAAIRSVSGEAKYLSGFSNPTKDRQRTNCFYLAVAGAYDSDGVALRYDEMTLAGKLGPLGSSWKTATSANSHPFDKTLGTQYPFPLLKGIAHYGDWPRPAFEKGALLVLRYAKAADGYTAVVAAMDCIDKNGNRLDVLNVYPNFYAGPVTLPAGAGSAGWAVLDAGDFIKNVNVKLYATSGGQATAINDLRNGVGAVGASGGTCYLVPGTGSSLQVGHDKNNKEWIWQFDWVGGALTAKAVS